MKKYKKIKIRNDSEKVQISGHRNEGIHTWRRRRHFSCCINWKI